MLVSYFLVLHCLLLAVTAIKLTEVSSSLHPRAFSSQQFSWYAPGNKYDGYVVTFVWPYGTIWVQPSPVNPSYTDSSFTQTGDQQLVSHSKTLCLIDPGSSYSSYWVGDPTVFSDHPPCYSSNTWGTYRNAFLTLGGGYDMFCLFTNSQGDALLSWMPGIPAYESGGNSPCANRGRVSIVGYSVQPAPATPIPPTSTVPGKGSGPTTSITTPPTTTTTTTATKTTMTTTTTPGYPNPIITSLMSTASSYLILASSAASSYSSNTTNAMLATRAEQALETAVTYLYDAKQAADDFAATSVSSALDSAADAYFRAAALAIVAAAAPAAAAAAAFFSGFAAIAPLFSKAASAANDPKQNPSPTRTTSRTTTTTTTTTTTASSNCPICVPCTDATYAEPSSTDALTKRNTHDFELTLGSILRLKVDALQDGYTSSNAYDTRSPPTSSSSSENEIANVSPNTNSNEGDESPWHVYAKQTKGVVFCNQKILAPSYYGYDRTSPNAYNPYKPYYNYRQQQQCGTWQFDLRTANSPGLFVNTGGYTFANPDSYNAEHIYEVQAIPLFFQWAVQNEPALQNAYGKSYTTFCAAGNLGDAMKTAQAFSTYSTYNYQRAPIQLMFDQMSDGINQPEEFVYLATSPNNVKGKLFGNNELDVNPTKGIGGALARATHILIVSAYLNDDPIVNTYQKVSRRLRCNVYHFGQAVMQATTAPYNQFKSINWLDLYDRWEDSYISGIQSSMNRNGLANFAYAQTSTRTQVQLTRNGRDERIIWARLASWEQLKSGSISSISISKLKRPSGQQPCT